MFDDEMREGCVGCWLLVVGLMVATSIGRTQSPSRLHRNGATISSRKRQRIEAVETMIALRRYLSVAGIGIEEKSIRRGTGTMHAA